MTSNFMFQQKDDWHDDGFTCRKRLYDRGVGLVPDDCSPGSQREYFVGMCYTPCSAGKTATVWSPVTCTQPCPPNTTEAGFANCTKGPPYGRGAGNWGNGCPGGYDNFGLWCFRWRDFSFSGYNCGGNCNFVPSDANYGKNTPSQCASGSQNQTFHYNTTQNPNQCSLGPREDLLSTPCRIPAYIQQPAFDGRGRLYSQTGCYPNPSNPAAYDDSLIPSFY